MAQLHDALEQIFDIRAQLTRTAVCTSLRSRNTLLTAGVAVVTAIIQQVVITNPFEQMARFVLLWCGAAAVSMLIIAAGIWSRMRHMQTRVERETTLQTIEQFVPSLVAGLMLTAAICRFAWPSVWLLPGLWMILLGLGIFAARRAWPRPVGRVGFFYFMAGLYALSAGPSLALHPWMMGGVFACGQLLASLMLYYWLERDEPATDFQNP